MIEILHAGVSTLVQDFGRPGFAHFGVSPSGAADLNSHRRANAFVGNVAEAASLEIVPPGFTCLLRTDVTLALTGAPAAGHLDGQPVPHDAVFAARAGQELRLDASTWGVRTYLAVRGGIRVAPVLGSRSYDTLSHLGPPPCQVGDVLPIGEDIDEQLWRAPAPLERFREVLSVPMVTTVDIDWVDATRLESHTYSVTAGGSRAALRLNGPPLVPLRHQNFPPQGLVRGAVQVPPDGVPIVFLADHPVTGGYPVIGVADLAVTDRLAQLRPGDDLRFVPRSSG